MSDTLQFTTHSARETEALGAKLARAMPVPMLLVLSGELGAGETAFVRGMAKGLDAAPEICVTSPTYVLQHAHICARATLYHIDAYRLAGGADEFEAGGLMECLSDPKGLVCIEWPERLADMIWPDNRIVVQIEHCQPEEREIKLVPLGEKAVQALERLRVNLASETSALQGS